MSGDYGSYGALGLDWPELGVLRVTLADGGRRGAMSTDTHRELSEIWRDVARDEQARAVLITAAGPHFSSGGDLSQLEASRDPERLVGAMDEARNLVYGMLDCPKPIVSAARGWAVGAGLALLLLADVSIVSADAKLADGHVKIGLAAGDHAAIAWPLLCGVAKAKYHLLTGESLTGAEAERIGLVSLAVADERLDERALEIAVQLARSAPNALRWTKMVINQWIRTAAPMFEASRALEMLGVAGPEGREGIEAFTEKRAPDWGP